MTKVLSRWGRYFAPLSVSRLAQEFGWRARFGCAESAADPSVWWTQHGEGLT